MSQFQPAGSWVQYETCWVYPELFIAHCRAESKKQSRRNSKKISYCVLILTSTSSKSFLEFTLKSMKINFLGLWLSPMS